MSWQSLFDASCVHVIVGRVQAEPLSCVCARTLMSGSRCILPLVIMAWSGLPTHAGVCWSGAAGCAGRARRSGSFALPQLLRRRATMLTLISHECSVSLSQSWGSKASCQRFGSWTGKGWQHGSV